MEYQIRISVFMLCATVAAYSYAYEPPTHENISEVALKESVLFKADGVLKELGMKMPDKIDKENTEIFHDFFLDKNEKSQRNVIGHVRFGSSYEDKENILWACSHFFDPVNDAPLRPILCPEIYNFRSPNWALYGTDSDGVFILERNDALMRHGNQRFFLALTSEDKITREEYFGALFRNLGQAIHHLQDMSQPQHVRDDAHLPILPAEISLYEKYSNCKYKVDKPAYDPGWWVRLFSSSEPTEGVCLNTPPEDIPQGYSEISLDEFNHSKKFWINYGKGMAEFTNVNFVSQDTNFRITSGAFNDPGYTYSKYSLPDPNNGGNGTNITTSRIEAPIPEGLGPDQSLSGETWFFGTMVKDKYTNSEAPNLRTSSLSIFASDLEGLAFNSLGLANPALVGRIPMFSLNRFTFDAAHEHLLPRAAAYSTGLIDYFFRG